VPCVQSSYARNPKSAARGGPTRPSSFRQILRAHRGRGSKKAPATFRVKEERPGVGAPAGGAIGRSVLLGHHDREDRLALVARAAQGLQPDQRRGVLPVVVADMQGEAQFVRTDRFCRAKASAKTCLYGASLCVPVRQGNNSQTGNQALAGRFPAR
jgi:hypothetical protein